MRQCCSPPRRWWGRAMPHLDHQQPLRQFHPIDRWRVRQLHIQIRRRCGTDLRGAVPHRLRRRAGWVSVHRRMPSGRCAVHHGALVVRTRPAALKNAAKHGWLKDCPLSGRIEVELNVRNEGALPTDRNWAVRGLSAFNSQIAESRHSGSDPNYRCRCRRNSNPKPDPGSAALRRFWFSARSMGSTYR